jgi:hypothetical protein
MALIQEHTEHMEPGETKLVKRTASDRVFKVGVRAGYILFYDETEDTEPTTSDLNADDWFEVHA